MTKEIITEQHVLSQLVLKTCGSRIVYWTLSGLDFRKNSVMNEWKRIMHNFREKNENLGSYTQIYEKF